MTDKVQKIREEVERLKGWNNNVRNSTRHMTLQEEDFNRGKHSSYLEILNFIDSLQEEPETPVWHDNKDTPVASKTKIVLYTNGKWDLFKAYKADNDFDNYWANVNQSLEEKGVLVKHWAYVDDLLTLSNLETTEKERKCMYSKDDYTDEDRKVLCNGCKEECEYSKSDDFTIVLAECISQAQVRVVDPLVLAETWKDELIKLAKSEEPIYKSNWLAELQAKLDSLSKEDFEKVIAKYDKYGKEEPVSDARVLGEYDKPVSARPSEYTKGFMMGSEWKTRQIKKSMDLGEPPYLISVEQAYYRTLKLLEE